MVNLVQRAIEDAMMHETVPIILGHALPRRRLEETDDDVEERRRRGKTSRRVERSKRRVSPSRARGDERGETRRHEEIDARVRAMTRVHLASVTAFGRRAANQLPQSFLHLFSSFLT